jgi:hypothetical protein
MSRRNKSPNRPASAKRYRAWDRYPSKPMLMR